mgnify:CR=1 FL=1
MNVAMSERPREGSIAQTTSNRDGIFEAHLKDRLPTLMRLPQPVITQTQCLNCGVVAEAGYEWTFGRREIA